MKVSNRKNTHLLRDAVTVMLCLLMTAPLNQAWAAAPQQATRPLPATEQAAAQLPDAPSASQTAQTTVPQTEASPTDASQQQGTGQQPAQQQPTQQQNSGAKPVGTAAAPLPKSGGVAASRPAGAVIAPGKQRRARAILISVGIVVATAVAVGTVVGLSKASPSRPN